MVNDNNNLVISKLSNKIITDTKYIKNSFNKKAKNTKKAMKAMKAIKVIKQ